MVVQAVDMVKAVIKKIVVVEVEARADTDSKALVREDTVNKDTDRVVAMGSKDSVRAAMDSKDTARVVATDKEVATDSKDLARAVATDSKDSDREVMVSKDSDKEDMASKVSVKEDRVDMAEGTDTNTAMDREDTKSTDTKKRRFFKHMFQ